MFLINAAAFVVVVAGMKAAAPIIVLLLLSIFLTVIITPLYIGLQKKGIRPWLALLILVLGLVFLTVVGVMVIGQSVNDFAGNLDSYQAQLEKHAAGWIQRLTAVGVEAPTGLLKEWLTGRTAIQLFGNTLAALSTIMSKAFLVLLITIFLLMEAALIPAKFKSMPGVSDAARRRASEIIEKFRHYMGMKTSMSLLTGVLVGVLLLVTGISYPFLLGLLAFLFNFVPNIGSVMAAIPAVLLAFLQYGTGRMIWLAVGYLVINVGISNFLEPKLMGRRLGLSPAIILVSLVFWGWVLGPVGMLLSVPLTMTVKIILESIRETRGLAILMGDRSGTPAEPPATDPKLHE